MSFVKKIIFIILIFISSCALNETRSLRKISSIIDCSTNLKVLLPTLHRAKGLEFEGAIPAFLDYEYIANFIGRQVKSYYPDASPVIDEVVIDGISTYKVRFQHNDQNYIYTVENDASLAFGLDETVRPIEVSSPILHSYQDIERHLSIIEDLKKVGLTARPDEGAIHIHHDLEDDFSFEDLYFIYTAFSKMQNSFRDAFHYNDHRGFNKAEHLDYIAKNLRRLLDSGEDLERSLEIIELVDNKGYLRTSHVHGTLEFRFFNSTTSKEEQLVFIDFINKFMKARHHPELIELIQSNKEVSIYDVSEIIGSNLHKQKELLDSIRNRNAYYEDLASLQEGHNPFLELRKTQSTTTNVTELIDYCKNSKSDLELSNYIREHLQSIETASFEKWLELLEEVSKHELSSLAIIKHIPQKSFTTQEIIKLYSALLKNNHGQIYSKTFDYLQVNIEPNELLSVIEQLYLPELSKMTAELDFSLSFLVDQILESNIEDNIKKSALNLLSSKLRIGHLTKSHIKIYELFETSPIHFNTLKHILGKGSDYSTFSHAPLYKKIIEKSSLDPLYLDNLFDELYKRLSNDQQIKFFYYFIEYLKVDNLEDTASLIPFFEKAFNHLKSFDKLQDMVDILILKHKEIFQGPKRNERLLSHIYRKLISLPKASRKKPLIKQIIRLTSRVKHLDYEYYIDTILKEMKIESSEDLTSDFIHLVSSAHKMHAIPETKLDTYLHFIWSELDKVQYYQLSSFQAKSLLDELNELNTSVIKNLQTRSIRRLHFKAYKAIRNRLENI